MTRICRQCQKEKPIRSFPRRYGKSAHLREHTCGVCKLGRFKARHPERWKEIHNTSDCGYRAKAKGLTVEQYVARRVERVNKLPKIRRRIRPLRCPALLANPNHDVTLAIDKAAASRDYYRRHIKTSRQRVQNWKRRNQAKVSAQHYRRRSHVSSARCDLTEFQWSAIKAAYGNRCAYCGQRKPLTQDHIIPISAGGEHTASNIVPACQSCNSSKGPRLPRVTYQPHLIV